MLGPVYGPSLPSSNWSSWPHTEYPVTDTEAISNIQLSLQHLAGLEYIQDIMSIQNVINPSNKEVVDTFEQVEEQIAQQFDSDREIESHEVVEQFPSVTAIQALQALQSLYLHEKQSGDSNYQFVIHLDRHKKVLLSRQSQKGRQLEVTHFFPTVSSD